MAVFEESPYSTVERLFKAGLAVESKTVQQTYFQEAFNRSPLVLGIDDFAIRKGHTYNTGIHNLKGGSLLDVIPGRTADDLQQYANQYPSIHALDPVVVMDMSFTYHKVIQS
ncbi:Transposase [Salibacterium halotolerans]|uniref:Transposase n=1 Tax=Salibacterium halotolerans TaxID=1884432 RepID=A0A1I5XYM6_9BACI|nr:Transposase [Salibacterium halotolerans]